MSYQQQLIDAAYKVHVYNLKNPTFDELNDFIAYFKGYSEGKWFLVVNGELFAQNRGEEWQTLMALPTTTATMYTLKSAIPEKPK